MTEPKFDPSKFNLHDYIYDLPEDLVKNQKRRMAYFIMVESMVKEAERIPMPTAQKLLIERIARAWIIMKEKEDTNGFPSATVQKDFYNTWLSMTVEFNKMLRAFEEKRQDRMYETMKNVLLEVLSSVEDVSMKNELLSKAADAFEKAGI